MSASMFRSLYHQGFARVAACTLPVALANPAINAQRILESAKTAATDGAVLCVFPELGLCGYTLEDLLQQEALLAETRKTLLSLAQASAALCAVLVVGAPLLWKNALYNCAIVIHSGKILGWCLKAISPITENFTRHDIFAPAQIFAGRQ
ncbi:NAD(+) synthase (glutamine-hydrolyzing) [Acetobacter pasteurianus subsp. pasteurianus]|uniref:NAD(+) synthase (Glutamine-hydrolyzing) n=1 Tax=Acetobacter pasteurianus subsp. pasteurianus TaxID=481145 RepID=A0AAC9X0Y3_ACEPA|nr:NAD(+) synthase (glutamine-hydrolyzing) [Acetobacter pasteurianus subsp. pasteurianus]